MLSLGGLSSDPIWRQAWLPPFEKLQIDSPCDLDSSEDDPIQWPDFFICSTKTYPILVGAVGFPVVLWEAD